MCYPLLIRVILFVLSESLQHRTYRIGRITVIAMRRNRNGAILQPSVCDPSVECRTGNSQSLCQFLFTEQSAACMRRNRDILFVYSQPIIERRMILSASFNVGSYFSYAHMRTLAGSSFANSIRERNSVTKVSKHASSEALISIFRRRGIIRVIVKSAFYLINIKRIDS